METPFDIKTEYAVAEYIYELEDSWMNRDYARHVMVIFDLLDVARLDGEMWGSIAALEDFRNLILSFCEGSPRRRMITMITIREVENRIKELAGKVQ